MKNELGLSALLGTSAARAGAHTLLATLRAPGHRLMWEGRRKPTDSVERILKRKGPQVHSISVDATVYEALEKMADKDVALSWSWTGSIRWRVLRRDYVRKVILKGRSSREMHVREIMSSPAVTVDSKATVDDCMALMTSKRFLTCPSWRQGGSLGSCRLATPSTGS